MNRNVDRAGAIGYANGSRGLIVTREMKLDFGAHRRLRALPVEPAVSRAWRPVDSLGHFPQVRT